MLVKRGLRASRQSPIDIKFQDRLIEAGFRADMIVNDKVIVEIKSIDRLSGFHDAQILTYMKLSGCELGLLLNFNVALMKDGIKRFYRPVKENLASLASWR